MIHMQPDSPLEAARKPKEGGITATSLTLGDVPDETLRRMLAYWQAKRSAAHLPARADIDPLEFRWALGLVCLLDVERNPLRFRYRLDGSAVADHQGADFTGRTTDELQPAVYAELLRRHFSAIVENATPGLHRITAAVEGRPRSYLRLALPLASDGKTVDMIMTLSTKGAEPAPPRGAKHRICPIR